MTKLEWMGGKPGAASSRCVAYFIVRRWVITTRVILGTHQHLSAFQQLHLSATNIHQPWNRELWPSPSSTFPLILRPILDTSKLCSLHWRLEKPSFNVLYQQSLQIRLRNPPDQLRFKVARGSPPIAWNEMSRLKDGV